MRVVWGCERQLRSVVNGTKNWEGRVLSGDLKVDGAGGCMMVWKRGLEWRGTDVWELSEETYRCEGAVPGDIEGAMLGAHRSCSILQKKR